MAKVNLLPWRAERRKERQQAFYVMLGLAVAAALVIGLGAYMFYSQQIDGQNARNAYLTDQITQLDAKIKEIEALDRKKEILLRRKDVIEQLQANRSQMVHLFDELVRTIPDGVRLTSVKQDGNKLTLQGLSQSNARVSAYMRNIESSGWMTNPDLNVIEAAGGDKALPYQFTLALTLTKPGQVLDANGQPVLGSDGKPVTKQVSGAAASPASSAATAATAPATSSAAAPASPAASPASAASKGGATP
ncbi:MAG: PilN domain-containing protein [Proteobacteria bacterium]|nr:PilN domain-containing protein [Pseudomonadota bacterium]